MQLFWGDLLIILQMMGIKNLWENWAESLPVRTILTTRGQYWPTLASQSGNVSLLFYRGMGRMDQYRDEESNVVYRSKFILC